MERAEIQCEKLQKTYIHQYFQRDQKHPLNQKYGAIIDFKGYVNKVSQKNPRFFMFFILLLIAMFLFIGLSLRRFNFRRLNLTQDFRADYCGQYQLQKQHFVYWPDSINWGTNVKACVNKCPEESKKENCLYNPHNTEKYEDYCYLTFQTVQMDNLCIPLDQNQRKQIYKYLYTGINLIIVFLNDIYKLKSLLVVVFFICLIFNLQASFFLSQNRYGLNIFYTIAIFILALCLSVLNVLSTGKFFLYTKQVCPQQFEECKVGNTKFEQFIFIMHIVLPSYVLIYCILNIRKIKTMFLLANFSIFFIKNKYQFFYSFLFIFLKFVVLIVGFVVIYLQSITGDTQNVKTGQEFYVPEVRGTVYAWYNWIGLILVVYIIYTIIKYLSVALFVLKTTLFAQHYFNHSRQWLKGLFKTSKIVLKQSKGQIFYYSYLSQYVEFLENFIRPLKNYFNKIDIAKKRHIFLIIICKPFIFLYDYLLKYHNLYQLLDSCLFGTEGFCSGQQIYYLLYRNQAIIKLFYNYRKPLCNILTLLQFMLIYLITSISLQTQFFQNMDFTLSSNQLHFVQYYPLIISTFFSLFFSDNFGDFEKSTQQQIIFYLIDKEMFKQSQQYTTKEFEEFVQDIQNKQKVKNEFQQEMSDFKKKITRRSRDQKLRNSRKNIQNFLADKEKNFFLEMNESQSKKHNEDIKEVDLDIKNVDLKKFIQRKQNQEQKKIFQQFQRDLESGKIKQGEQNSEEDIKIEKNSYALKLLKQIKKAPIEKKKGQTRIKIEESEEEED